MIVPAFLLGALAASVLLERLQRKNTAAHDATQRRIGWAYGYGQGYIDGTRSTYKPGAPADGRVRS